MKGSGDQAIGIGIGIGIGIEGFDPNGLDDVIRHGITQLACWRSMNGLKNPQ